MRDMMTLVEAGIKCGNARKHKWTDDEKDIVRRDYVGTNASAVGIASKIGVTPCAVKGKVQEMGIAQQKSPPWTQEELKRLSELIHRYSIRTIAEKMNRSLNAVKIKATRLKMGLRARDGWFTKREASEILGVDHKWVQTRIDSGLLKASYHNGVRPQQNGPACWHIEEADLRAFIINHCGELLGRNVDLQQIIWLVRGEG